MFLAHEDWTFATYKKHLYTFAEITDEQSVPLHQKSKNTTTLLTIKDIPL